MHGLSIPLILLTNIILARSLGAESFGLYAFVMSAISLIALPAVGGVPQLLIREVARCTHEKNWGLLRGAIRSAQLWVLSVSLILVLVLGLVLVSIPETQGNTRWILISLAILLIPLNGTTAVRCNVVKGLGMPAIAEIPTQFVQPIVLLVVISVLSFFQLLQSFSAVTSQVAVAAFVCALSCLLCRKKCPSEVGVSKPNYEHKKWTRSLLPFTIIALVSTLNTQICVILLGLLGGNEAVGGLKVAERGAQIVSMPALLISAVAAPHIVRAYHQGSRAQLRKISILSARGATLCALPLAITLFLFGETLISITFGNEYIGKALVPLKILVASQLLNATLGSIAVLLTMSGNEGSSLQAGIAGVAVTVCSCLALIPACGVVGAAISSALGLLTWTFLMAYFVKRKLGFWPGFL